MSATAYLASVTGAATFGGTSATTVFDSPPADFDDGDLNDVLQIRSTGSLLWETPGEMIELVARLRANGTTISTMQFGAIGADEDARDVTLEWWLTLTAADTCRVESKGVITGAAGQGPNRDERHPITRGQPFVLPVTFDITVQMDEVAAEYTADGSWLHKVEPTLSAEAGTASVVSVNGLTGAVVLTPAIVGAVPDEFQGMPTVLYNAGTSLYPGRPLVFYPCLYIGPVAPTLANCTDPNFSSVDFWLESV